MNSDFSSRTVFFEPFKEGPPSIRGMESNKVIDYFVVAGLGKDKTADQFLPRKNSGALDGYMDNAKNVATLAPITDVVIINRSAGEAAPPGYVCIEKTPAGSSANLNAGAIRCAEMYICFRRGMDRPPLTDIGVLYEGKERLMPGCEIIVQTPYGRPANVNNQSNANRIFLLFRRAESVAPANSLAVTDICVMNGSKGETPPHTFCQIPKTLNRGLVGSNVFVCYKKSMLRPKALYYEGKILSRYPMTDHPGFPLPAQVPLFCLPLGSVIECWPVEAEPSPPVFSRFVLTGADGIKVYGAAISFYEPYQEDELSLDQRRQLGLSKFRPDPSRFPPKVTIQTSKCICVLSKFPFYDAFRKFLSFVYRYAITGPHALPLERHITHLIDELPFPSPQRPRILYPLGRDVICLEPPEETHLQPSGACYRALIRNLGADNCLNLLVCVLGEQKVVIHSLRPDVVTMVAEAAANMIFPFHWQCPYIPLCPLDLSDVLFAPLPFIVGVDSRYFDVFEPPPDVICFDLDTNTIFMPEDKKHLNFKTMLPKRPSKALRSTLQQIYEEMQHQSVTAAVATDSDEESMDATEIQLGSIDHNFRRKRQEQQLQLSIQEAFLRFMASILRGYGNFLLPVNHVAKTTDPHSLFDMTGFLKSRDKTHLKFYSMMTSTQAFSRFLEERSFVSQKDASLAFFDDCISKVEQAVDEDVRLVDIDEVGAMEAARTVFVPPPDDKGLVQGKQYCYQIFPDVLNPEYFACSSSASAPPNLPSTPFASFAPMTRRSKTEVRAAQRFARSSRASPRAWSKCLLSHVFTLWFVHVPALVKSTEARATKTVRLAYDVLACLNEAEFVQIEELNFRIVMQLCGVYGLPVLAVKVMVLMKAAGIQPNAITYGLYNKAILESKRHFSVRNSAFHLWRKLSHVVSAVAQFKCGSHRRGCVEAKPGTKRAQEPASSSELSLDAISRDSADSGGMTENGFVGISYTIPVSPSREEYRPIAEVVRPAKFPDVERGSTGGGSDRGYASLTKEEAREIASNLASPEMASTGFYSADSAPQFPLAGGMHPIGVIAPAPPVLTSSERRSELPIENQPKDSQEKTEDDIDEAKVDSAKSKVNELSHTVSPAIASISQSASSGIQGAVSYGSSYIEAAKPIIQTSLEVATATVFGTGLPSSSSLSQIESEFDGTNCRKETPTVARSQTVVGFTERFSREVTPTENSAIGNVPRVEPRAPRPRLGSIVKVRKSLNTEFKGSEEADIETSFSGSAGILLSSQLHQSPGVQPPLSKPEFPSFSPLDSVDMSPLERLDPLIHRNSVLTDSQPQPQQHRQPLPSQTKSSLNGNKSARSNLYEQFRDVESDPLTSGDVSPTGTSSGAGISSWGPWIVHDEPVNNDSTSSRNASDVGAASAASIQTLPVFSLAQQDPSLSLKPSGSCDPCPASSSSSSSNVTFPVRLPPAPTTASPRRHFAPHSSEGDLLAASDRGAFPLTTSSSMEGYLDVRPSRKSRGMSENSRGKASTPTPRPCPPVNGASPSAVYTDGLNTPRTSTGIGGFDDPVESPLVGSFLSFASTAASSFSSKLSGLKNSLSTPSRLGSSQDSLAKTVESDRRVDDEEEEEENLLGGAAAEFEGAEGLSPPKSSRITGASRPGSGVWGVTPQTTPQSTPQKPPAGPAALRPMGQKVESLSSIASTTRTVSNDNELSDATSLDSHHLFGETLTSKPSGPPHVDVEGLRKTGVMENGIWQLTSVLIDQASEAEEPVALDISITSCTTCQDCKAVLFDEEIMAGWSPDDSNLSTKCPFCGSLIVPSLTILVRDFRSSPRPPRVIEEEDLARPAPANAAAPTADAAAAAPHASLVTPKLFSENDGEPKTQENFIHHCTPPRGRPPVSPPPKSPDRRRAISECNTLSSAASTPGVNIDVDDLQFDGLEFQVQESKEQSRPSSPPLTVPYLSPLTLRKEVENILETEGDWTLNRTSFADDHPICFWNLLFYFKRLDLSTHLPAVLLKKNLWNRDDEKIHHSWLNADMKNVRIRPVWDREGHRDLTSKPLYSLWNSGEPTTFLSALVSSPVENYQSLMKELLASIACNDLLHPIRLVARHREQSVSLKSVPLALAQLSLAPNELIPVAQPSLPIANATNGQRSIYREILFLSIAAYGAEDIDLKAFDWKYKQAYGLAEREPTILSQLRPHDALPNIGALWCRKCFGVLALR